MRNFAQLFTQLDQATTAIEKVSALAEYFRKTTDEDRIWAMAILSHHRPKRKVSTTLLRTWAIDFGDIPDWLFDESHQVVGDLAETIALILPKPTEASDHSLSYWIDYIKALGDLAESKKEERIYSAWRCLEATERFVFNKLVTGGFRVNVSQKIMVQALAKYTNIQESTLAHRLVGNWTPDTITFSALILSENPLDDISKPYPFYQSYVLEEGPESLGAPREWQAERKWDGIRGQIIIRNEKIFVWSGAEELITDKFPEYKPLASLLPHGIVLDGEIMPFKEGKFLPFQELQARINRKTVTKGILQKTPVVIIVYDLLEWQGEDIRSRPLAERRVLLEQMLDRYDTKGILLLSDIVSFNDWPSLYQERVDSRKYSSKGIMLKHRSSSYQSGRKRGNWWKWKAPPLTIDAVMLYAQSGQSRPANLFSKFTFAVWKEDLLVPFTKADSGLTNEEYEEITKWARKNTLERFGPVRSVTPHYVFEIAFDGIQRSSRHKSGVTLRFPRISRWRKDKTKDEANSLDDLLALLELYG